VRDGVAKPDTGSSPSSCHRGCSSVAGTRRDTKNILEAGLLEAVIWLPPNLFHNASLPACILMCRSASTAERSGRVLFIDASKRFVKRGNRNVMREEDIEGVVQTYTTGSDADGLGGVEVALAVSSEIEKNGSSATGTQ